MRTVNSARGFRLKGNISILRFNAERLKARGCDRAPVLRGQPIVPEGDQSPQEPESVGEMQHEKTDSDCWRQAERSYGEKNRSQTHYHRVGGQGSYQQRH